MRQETRLHGYALLVREGRILLCRISDQIPKDSGRWTLPGGRIEFEETLAEGVERELKEETGLEVELGPVEWVETELFDLPQGRVRVVRVVFRARVTGGKLRSEQEGTTDLCEWIDLDSTPSLPLVPLAQQAAARASLVLARAGANPSPDRAMHE